jgi:FdhD protein
MAQADKESLRMKNENQSLEPSAGDYRQVYKATAKDQNGNPCTTFLPVENPLTIRLNQTDIATLMTIGTHPRELSIGFLRNQFLISDIDEIDSVTVDRVNEVVNVSTHTHKPMPADRRTAFGKLITSGCGQGNLLNCLLEKIYESPLAGGSIQPSTVFALMKNFHNYNEIYRKAGSVHGCALCRQSHVLMYIEDIGRHNAADVISGKMLIDGIAGDDKLLYTTGRITSEIVIKAAIMRIPILLSKSGATSMALELAQDLGITLVTRARGSRFLIYNEAAHE